MKALVKCVLALFLVAIVMVEGGTIIPELLIIIAMETDGCLAIPATPVAREITLGGV
jgi:hypothetical protein